jgi:hypothetical protein
LAASQRARAELCMVSDKTISSYIHLTNFASV